MPGGLWRAGGSVLIGMLANSQTSDQNRAMTYYRPIPMTDAARPNGALTLAGGWCWFDRVEVLDGLKSEEGVAVKGAGFLNEGDLVKVVQ